MRQLQEAFLIIPAICAQKDLKKKKKVKKLAMFNSRGRTFQNRSIANTRAMKAVPG